MSEFADQVEYAARPVEMVWRLMVFDAPDRFGGMLKRFRFRPTKKNRSHWWRLFDPKQVGDRTHAQKCVPDIKNAGMALKWTEVVKREPRAEPQKRKARVLPQPNAQILSLEIAAENRIAQDALKLTREKRRQAEKLAQVEVYQNADRALRRARGEQ